MTGLLVRFLIAFAVFVPLERLLARDPEQRVFHAGWWSNAVNYFVNGAFPALAVRFGLIVGPATFGWTDQMVLPINVRGQNEFVQFVAAMLIGGFVSYWLHRLQHSVPL